MAKKATESRQLPNLSLSESALEPKADAK